MSNETDNGSVEPLACPTCARKYPLSERFCADCQMPLVYVGRGEEEPITAAHERARKVKPQYLGGELNSVVKDHARSGTRCRHSGTDLETSCENSCAPAPRV